MQLKKKILVSDVDFIGISVVTPNVNVTREIISFIKKNKKNVMVVVGGPHVTIRPEDLLDVADVCIRGEGEETLSELIDCLNTGKEIYDIDGIVYKDNVNLKVNPSRRPLECLDEVPFPALDLLDLSRYRHIYPYKNNQRIASILTARGCPYNCHFCGNNSLWNGNVRYRSIDNVIEEIKQIRDKLDVLLFWIEDDLFGSDSRVREFCKKAIDNELNIKWMCHIRCDSISEETLFLMKEAGCLEVQVGVESGDDSILQAINKNLTIKQIESFFLLAKRIGINIWATFIFGLYGENKETIKKSIALSKRLDPTYVTFIHLLPFPGTQIYEDYSAKGYIKTYDWSKYSWHHMPVFEIDSLNLEDLVKLKKRAYLEFYLRPRKLFSYIVHLFKTGSVKLMFRNLLLFIKLSLNV